MSFLGFLSRKPNQEPKKEASSADSEFSKVPVPFDDEEDVIIEVPVSTGSPTDAELKCPSCSGIFQDPRILACGHSACFSCLSKQGSSITCPTCRLRSQETQPASLPKNHTLARLAAAVSQATPLCEECSAVDAAVHCPDCKVYLCTTCSSKIHSTKALQKHVIGPYHPPTVAVPCPNHPDESVSLFVDDLGLCVCAKCVTNGLYQAHKATPIRDAALAKKKELLSAVRGLADLCAPAGDPASKAKGDLRRYFATLRKMLDQREAEMLAEAEALAGKLGEQSPAKPIPPAVTSLVGETRRLLSLSSDADVIQMADGLSRLLRESKPGPELYLRSGPVIEVSIPPSLPLPKVMRLERRHVVVKDWSKTNTEFVQSPSFAIADCQWHLAVYPKGDIEARNKFCSVFLFAEPKPDEPKTWKRTVTYALSVLNQFDSRRTIMMRSDPDTVFSKVSDSWGFGDLIDLQTLQNVPGFLFNDTVVFQVTVLACTIST